MRRVTKRDQQECTEIDWPSGGDKSVDGPLSMTIADLEGEGGRELDLEGVGGIPATGTGIAEKIDMSNSRS